MKDWSEGLEDLRLIESFGGTVEASKLLEAIAEIEQLRSTQETLSEATKGMIAEVRLLRTKLAETEQQSDRYEREAMQLRQEKAELVAAIKEFDALFDLSGKWESGETVYSMFNDATAINLAQERLLDLVAKAEGGDSDV